ncbi:MAG: hypothetical protein ABSH22_09340 [Tepidisphaeraceae bacterium]|jgi:hypothetical protein
METNNRPVLTTATDAPIGLQQAITAGPRSPERISERLCYFNGSTADGAFPVTTAVAGVGPQRDYADRVHVIVELARHLALVLGAEGIETQDQFAMHPLIDGDEMHGFDFSEPMPTAEAEVHLDKIVSRKEDHRGLTGPIAWGRFFGEGGPENLPADSDAPPGIEEVEIVADGQIAEPGMTPPMLDQPSIGLNFFGQRS